MPVSSELASRSWTARSTRLEEGASQASLPAMSSYERKLVHDIVAGAGLHLGVVRRGRRPPHRHPSPETRLPAVSRETSGGGSGRTTGKRSMELRSSRIAAASIFGDRIEVARRFTGALAAEGEERGLIGPWSRRACGRATS